MLRTETKELVTELVAKLRTVPEAQFHYWEWVGYEWQGEQDLSCGAPACAAGWAATLPSFQDRGLRLLPGRVALVGEEEQELINGVSAMAGVLGITTEAAVFLFCPCTYRTAAEEGGIFRTIGRSSPGDSATPSEVADHLELWMAEEEAGGQ